MSTAPHRKLWTRAECEVLESSGVWAGQHWELINGELYNKMGKKQPHAFAQNLLALWLEQIFGREFVSVEWPIDVAPEDNPTSSPEPDIIVLHKSGREFSTVTPRPRDLRLVVEVSDTTLRLDLGDKALLYARAGIVEYWVLNVNARELTVHMDALNGVYQSVKTYSENETVASGAISEPFHVALLYR